MKHVVVAVAALVVAAAIATVAYLPGSSSTGSTASRTVYSFAYALSHHNFGRACSYIAQNKRGKPADCSAGLTYNAGFSMLLGGVDIFAGMHVVAGSEHPNKDGSVTYKMRSPEIPPTAVRVARQPGGRWRVTRIGG